MRAVDWFSPDYATARERFREAARRAEAELHAIDAGGKGPGEETLAIDLAWFGPRRPRRALVHLSGVHGVEGFAGSAIQLAWLARERPQTAGDAAVALVHAVNPYGMAWLRRVNERNVDLNRNVLRAGERYAGAPELYRKLDGFLNPKTPPSRGLFYARAGLLAARYGMRRLTEAIAAGQYKLPQGLFYGGARLEDEPRKLLAFLSDRLEDAEALTAIDVHTGLGPWGRDTLLEHTSEGRSESREGVAYPVRGPFGMLFPLAAPRARVRYVLQEFGTRHAVRVLRALREENRWAQHGGGGLDHPAKQRLREAFAPKDAGWRSRVLERGVELLGAAAAEVSE